MTSGDAKIAGNGPFAEDTVALQDNDDVIPYINFPVVYRNSVDEFVYKKGIDICSGANIMSSLWKIYNAEASGAVVERDDYRALKACGETGVDVVIERYRTGDINDEKFIAFIRTFEEYAGSAIPELLSILERVPRSRLEVIRTIGLIGRPAEPYAKRLLGFAKAFDLRDNELVAETLSAFARMKAMDDDVISFMTAALKGLTAKEMPEILDNIMPGEMAYYPFLIYVVDNIDIDKSSRATELLEMMDIGAKGLRTLLSDIKTNTLIALPSIVRSVYQRSHDVVLDVLMDLIRSDPDDKVRSKALRSLNGILGMSDISPGSANRKDPPKAWHKIVAMLNGVLMLETSTKVKEEAVWCIFTLQGAAKDSLPYLYNIIYENKDQKLVFAAKRAIQNMLEDIM